MNYSNQHFPIPTDPSWDIIDTSKIKKVMECPREFLFEYLFGWRPARPSVHIHFGLAWHDALEFLLLNGYSLECYDKAYKKFLIKYREVFDPAFDDINSPKNPYRAKETLLAYTGKYQDDLKTYKVLHTEVGGLVNISEKFKLAFRMDAVLESERGISIMDHKTASNINSLWIDQWLLSPQIGTYLHAGNSAFGRDKVRELIINGAAFRKVKDNSKAERFTFQRVSCARTAPQMRQWLSNMNRYMEWLDHNMELLSEAKADDVVLKAFPMNTEGCMNYNRKCSYFDFCVYFANPIKAFLERGIPEGFKQEFWNPFERELKLKVGI